MTTEQLFEVYRSFVEANRSLRPSFETVPLSEQQYNYQYVGGQFIDGVFYAVPNSAERVLRFDPVSGEMNFFGDLGRQDFKWTGGCVREGKLVSFPRTASSLLSFDPKTSSCELIPCLPPYPQEHHYSGVCVGDVVYQPPRSTDHILKWNLSTGETARIPVNGGQVCRYCGSVLYPDGSVYFIPERDFPVLRFDPKTERIEPIGEPVSGMTFDPTVAADGNIYGFCTSRGLYKIDPSARRTEILFPETEFSSYTTKAGIDGRLYGMPGYSRFAWAYDPFTGELERFDPLSESVEIYYAGGAVSRTGEIISVPVFSDNLLRMRFDRAVEIPETLYEAFFRDFY